MQPVNLNTSQSPFSKAKHHIPGGVNSPVRAFNAVGGIPVFIKSAKGAYLYDEDGNRYIDLIGSWGPMILGHAYPEVTEAIIEAVEGSSSFGTPTRREVTMAELICEMMPSIEKVRMVNSGTEATMSAVRVARGYTGRDKFIKTIGCYHGHGDSFLIAAGSGAATMGTPNSPGVTTGTAKDTLLAPHNDLEAIQKLIDANPNQVAAIIIEPVAGNMGCVLPKEGYLEGLKNICDTHGIVLIFDEVMTGFRLAKGGAQEVFGVRPDMTTLGKIIGGGLPVGAYGGKKEIMDCVSPIGKVYQAGTLSGNPVAMAAGLAILSILNNSPQIYQSLEQKTAKIADGMRKAVRDLGLPYTVNQIGSMTNIFFTERKVENFDDALSCDTGLFGKYFHAMLNRGVYIAPAQFESWFLSNALSDEDVKRIIEANEDALREIHN